MTAIETVLVVLRDQDGRVGLGTASPERHVTGETNEACQQALAPGALDFLIGQDVAQAWPTDRSPAQLQQRMRATPAARAAVDMALWDLHARALGRPLCDVLGRKHAGAAHLDHHRHQGHRGSPGARPTSTWGAASAS